MESSLLPSPSIPTQILTTPTPERTQPILKLRLQKKKKKKAKTVGWTENTVDNEHMNRRKSKCCCIYKKPAVFGESSSEDDEECEHCFGHPEKRLRNRKDDATHDHSPDDPNSFQPDDGGDGKTE